LGSHSPMIAIAQPVRRPRKALWHERFLAMVPVIRRQARFAFRHIKKDSRDDAVAEVVANALVAFVRLVERGKGRLAYPTVLARYAVAQIRAGRRVGSGQKKNDVLAGMAGNRHGISVHRLDRFDSQSGRWVEVTLEDKRTPVPEQAAFRCDFPAWLATHTPRNRRIAESLSLGASTQEVSRQFGVSPARISQLRREFHDSWLEFHGEATGAVAAATKAA
ncbi:MAG TPA: hypothetical protein VMP01_02405, partial [Pirellulaceae bacterium]|nr:hypothetical protein [Pirellulaceae bacterium]